MRYVTIVFRDQGPFLGAPAEMIVCVFRVQYSGDAISRTMFSSSLSEYWAEQNVSWFNDQRRTAHIYIYIYIYMRVDGFYCCTSGSSRGPCKAVESETEYRKHVDGASF